MKNSKFEPFPPAVEAEDVPSGSLSPSPPPPTFTGRLQLKDFMFKRDTGVEVRRSPRLSTIPSASAPSPTAGVGDASRSESRSKKNTFASPSSLSRALSSKRKSPLTEEEEDDESSSSPSKRSPKKSKTKTKTPASYAPPSTYAHLSHLPDAICPGLLVLFIGLNPGIQTARTGHAYAHPTNLFWRLLYSSGVTPRLCSPTEDRQMPSLYSLGLTNIVARPSRNGAELSKKEMDDGVEILEEKVREYKPEAVCVVGKSIWESLWRVKHGRAIKSSEFRYGWQDLGLNMGLSSSSALTSAEEEKEQEETVSEEWKGARVFVATSTSGLAATLKPHEKEAVWRELGGWVERRREERKEGKVTATPPGVVERGC